MAKFGKGSKHTLETRQKMSAARRGMKRSEETKRKISESNQRTKALARGPLPERAPCGTCTEREGRRIMKPIKDFYIRQRTLRSGEMVFYVYPHCKACERERVRQHRDSLGTAENRRRQRVYNAAHRRRVAKARKSLAKEVRLDKGPFIEWFIDYRDRRTPDFMLDGQFDGGSFAASCGIELHQYRSLTRLARANAPTSTIPLRLVETILIALDMEYKLAELYPEFG